MENYFPAAGIPMVARRRRPTTGHPADGGTGSVERAKRLVDVARQIEQSTVAAIEAGFLASYTEFLARQDLELAVAGTRLKELEVVDGAEEPQPARRVDDCSARHLGDPADFRSGEGARHLGDPPVPINPWAGLAVVTAWAIAPSRQTATAAAWRLTATTSQAVRRSLDTASYRTGRNPAPAESGYIPLKIHKRP